MSQTGDQLTRRWAWPAIGAAGFLAIVLLYRGAWGMLPAGDDWQPPLSEIYRASVTGPWSLVTHNAWQHPAWRPLQSLAFLALSKLPGDLFAWLSVLNLACAALATATLLLWSRALGLPPLAALVAALAFAAHPINVAAIASNDGFGSVLTPACAWLCCWILWRRRDRPWIALAMVVPIYLIASGVKEYVFALVPMACATTLLTYRRPVRWMLVVGAVLSLATVAALAVRKLLVPLREMGEGVGPNAGFSPLNALKNTAMGVAAALAPSNTVTYFTTTGSGRTLVFAIAVALTLAIIALGATYAIRASVSRERSERIDPARGAILLVLLTLGSLFPANVSMRISEMYLLGLGLGVALLIGLAARGAIASPRVVRVALVAMMVAWLAWAATSTLAKVGETRRTGELSYALGRWLADTLPPEPGKRIAILYDDAAVRRLGHYSVFRTPRSGLVVKETIQWFRPGYGGSLENIRTGPGEPAPNVDDFDVVVAWDVDRWQGTYLKR